MLGLRDEVNQSTSRMVLFAFLRSLFLIAVVIGLAFLFARTARINYYSDQKYDQEAYETIVWEDENLEKLDEAYEKGDFKTIRSLYAENSRVVESWPHYADYVLKYKYQTFSEYDRMNTYSLQNVLYFLYFPEYFTYRKGMDTIDTEQYEAMRQSLLNKMAEFGYTEAELEKIYKENSDSYGYMDVSALDAYVKE